MHLVTLQCSRRRDPVRLTVVLDHGDLAALAHGEPLGVVNVTDQIEVTVEARPTEHEALIRCAELHGWLRREVLSGLRAQAEAAYRDDGCPERLCDRCGTPYRGPAVYCSLPCAEADA